MTLPAQDIVERLLDAAERATRTRAERYREAADTISRLTADNEALRETNEKLGRALFWFAKYPEYKPNPEMMAQWSADLEAAKPFIPARAALGGRP